MTSKPYMADVLFPGAKKPVRAIVVPFEAEYVAEIVDAGDGKIAPGRERIEDSDADTILRWTPMNWSGGDGLGYLRDRALEAARALLPAADDDGDAALDRKRDDEIDKEAK